MMNYFFFLYLSFIQIYFIIDCNGILNDSQILSFERQGFLFLPEFISLSMLEELRDSYLETHVKVEREFLIENFKRFRCKRQLDAVKSDSFRFTCSSREHDTTDVSTSIEQCKQSNNSDDEEWPDLQLSGFALRNEKVGNLLKQPLFAQVASQLLQKPSIRFYIDAPFFKGFFFFWFFKKY